MAMRIRRIHKVGLAASLVMLMVLAAAWWLLNPFQASAEDAAVRISKVEGTSWRPDRGEPLFILVLGSDARRAAPSGGGGRCDAIHIVGINPQTKSGTILNFPRDSYVPVAGMGTTKINAACTRGGAANMVQTLRSLTGIPIHYYAITEFTHFVAFIDEIGGLEVQVPYRMRDPYSGADFLPGARPMLGGHVLAFSRNRHDTPRGDFSRAENQGIVIISAAHKFRFEANDNPHRIFEYMRIARRHISSDVPTSELVKLALIARDIDPLKLQNITIGGSTGSAGGASVVFLAPGDTYARVRDDAIY
jgi:polyisoprenyl-teichoic acid--peptidoglycan teichoic acid transferase